MPHRHIYPGPKARSHFPRLREDTRIPYTDMLYFDASSDGEVAVDIASSCPGILCVRTTYGICESDLDFGLTAFAEGKKGVQRNVFPRKAVSPFRKMLASKGCFSESLQSLGTGPGVYDCRWRSAGGFAISDKLYSNDNISECSRWGCVHRWRTTPLPDGGHMHRFTSIHAPSFKPPQAFPAAPRRPASPGPPSNDFLRKFFDEDEAWAQFRTEEEKLKMKAEEQSEVDQLVQEDKVRDDIAAAAREKIAALDPSGSGGFSVVTNEGSFVVGRCCEGKGSHVLPLKTLVEILTDSGYARESFEDFVALEKPNYVGQDLSRLVRAFIKVSPVPDNPELEAKYEELDALAGEAWMRGHVQRKDAMQDQILQRRATRSEEATEEWLASRIHTPVWKDFLQKAEVWVSCCESLHEKWDHFECARSQWKEEVGEDKRFADRAFPSAPTVRWDTDPLLRCAAKVVPDLATRWEQVLSRS